MADKRFIDSYDRIGLDPEAADRIWARVEQELLRGEENNKTMKMRIILRTALIAAVVSVLLITTAYAVSGVVRGTVTHLMKDTGSFDSLEALPKAERIVGYPITAPEAFSNGYVFRSLDVAGEMAYDENYEPLKEYYTVHINYEKDRNADLSLNLSPVLTLPTETDTAEEGETKEIEGVEVRFSQDHFKFVPPDYEKTSADLEAEAAGHYFISFGAEKVEEFDDSFAIFTLGEVEYTLFDQGCSDAETLCQMATEVIVQYHKGES